MCPHTMRMLAGMLKLVLSKGGKEELRIALHCFKDQLTAATNRCAGNSSAHHTTATAECTVCVSHVVGACQSRGYAQLYTPTGSGLWQQVQGSRPAAGL
jgi:hypothetical protein